MVRPVDAQSESGVCSRCLLNRGQAVNGHDHVMVDVTSVERKLRSRVKVQRHRRRSALPCRFIIDRPARKPLP